MRHQDFCEAEVGHDYDCVTATRLARLRAFAEDVQAELACTAPDATADEKLTDEHLTDCWHCAAGRALERPRG
jgi:hypothetical protein